MIKVHEGQAVKKGDLVVQLYDSSNKMISVEAPFDCMISAFDVQYGQQLFEPSKIAWVHDTASSRERPLEVTPKPAPKDRYQPPEPKAAKPTHESTPNPTKRYYHSADGAWKLRLAAWLGFLVLFLFSLVVISNDPEVLEVFGNKPVLVFATAFLAPLLAGVMGCGAGIAVVEQFSNAVKNETEAREAVTKRIKNGEDVNLPKGYALPSVLAFVMPLAAAIVLTAGLGAHESWRKDSSQQRVKTPPLPSSVETTSSAVAKSPEISASKYDLTELLSKSSGSGVQAKNAAMSILGTPLDICYEIWAPVSAAQMDELDSCPGCSGERKTLRQSFIQRWQGFRDENLMLSISSGRPLNYLRYIDGLANLECADLPLHRCGNAVGGCSLEPHYAMILSYHVYDLADNPCRYSPPLGHNDLETEKQIYLERHSNCRPLTGQSWKTGTIPIE